jgi:signal transduction histidine kinase
MGNASGLGRVFNNLLSNAIKFTPDNGTIHLNIEPGPPGKVHVKVADTGIGIPEDKIPYLFDQFTSTSQSGTSGEVGTGLGMSIVKEILEKHGSPSAWKAKPEKGPALP